jgi:thioredoxin reductase (NADPH)
MEKLYDTVIIGGGVAGFGAAMYAARLGLKSLVISEIRGGTIILTDIVENYPGFKKLTGLELAEKIEEHAKEYGIEVIDERASKVEKSGNCYSVTAAGKDYKTKTVIFATGTKWKKLGVPGEEEFANKGVHYCALCDGAFYKGKVIGVVGSGDSAVKEALLLSTFGAKVYIFARGERLKPEPVNLERAKANPKIEVVTKINVKEIRGEKKVTHVVFDRELNGSKELALDALFIEIGHIPLSELAKELGVACDEHGEIKIDRLSRTNMPGVYAAGDVADSAFKQAITGVAEGVNAAYSAYEYVNKNTGITC